jgi:hypothetical protein
MDFVTDDNVMPLRPLGPRRKDSTAAPRKKKADPTNAERSKRWRERRKQQKSAVADSVAQHPIETLSQEALPTVAEPILATVVPVSAERRKCNDFNTSDTLTDRCATRSATIIDVLAYIVAVGLTTVAALFSVKGMVTLFPGSPVLIIAMSSTMEGGKLIGTGWLASRWRETPWIWRIVVMVLIAGLALINAAGVASQLVVAHVGQRGTAISAIETQDAALAAKLESQIHIVADIDRRLGQIDSAIDEATRRGRTKIAMATMEGQRKARVALVGERNETAATLANLQTERATLAAKGRQQETEAAPIVYVAEMLGITGDSEQAIRWLIALMVMCCDPLAIALTAAASARRNSHEIPA